MGSNKWVSFGCYIHDCLLVQSEDAFNGSRDRPAFNSPVRRFRCLLEEGLGAVCQSHVIGHVVAHAESGVLRKSVDFTLTPHRPKGQLAYSTWTYPKISGYIRTRPVLGVCPFGGM